MRPRTITLAVVTTVALAGCQAANPELQIAPTSQSESPQSKTSKSEASQSDRLVALAADIEARGESSTAIALYERAAALPDASPNALVKAGEAYMRAGYPEQAAKVYREALARSPNNGPALLGLGSVMIELGDADAGIRALTQAAPIFNTSRAYNRLGVAQIFAGQLDQARESLAQALKLEPGDVDVQTNMALAAALEGDAATALPLVQKVAAAPNAQLHHKRNVVVVYGLLGKADQIRAAAPIGLTTKEVNTLLARAKSIRAENSVKAKAKALGSISA